MERRGSEQAVGERQVGVEDLEAGQTDAAAPWRTRYPDVGAIEETPACRPTDELIERSGRADLLVVGSHRHGPGPHIGSVSHGVIHHADCPVAVIAASTTQTA